MTNEKLFDLTQELLERMEMAKNEAKDLEKKYVESEFPFVHIEDKEYVNPKFLSFADHCKIVELGRFLKQHIDIKEKDLSVILWMNKTRFQILLKVKNIVPNLIEQIRAHDDEKYIPYLYFGLNQSSKDNGLNI